jgi:hypothetical protein
MTEQNFGAVLDARGFPPENVQLGDYRGLAFWDTDTFGDRNLGLGFGHASRVLIGGDGDGALQDFLRIATGKQSAAEIMKVIEPGLDRNLLREIYSEEDQAFRAKTWNQRIHDHKVQCRLDRLHIQWAGDIVKPGSYARALLEGLVKFSSRIDLDLVHPCEHFTAIYPLNRFLVYLIAAVAPASIRILPRTKVNKVTCRHDPPRGPWTCVGQEHEVELQDSPDCIWPAHNGASAAKPTPKSYDTVILRLGLERLPAERFLFRSPRQLLPYHPPV